MARLQLPHVSREAIYRNVAPIAVAIVGITAVLVLAGWAAGNEYLKRIVPGLVAMNPLTAASFLAAAAALYRSGRGGVGGARGVGFALAGIIVVTGAAKLSDLVFGTSFELDRILFASQLDPAGLVPNRMAPNTALCFLLSGTALLLLPIPRRGALVAAQLLAVLVMLLSLVAVVGYTYGIVGLYGVGKFIPMALHTATSFLVLASGILFARHQAGLMTIVTSDTAGGLIARLLLPAAILIPIAVGWLPLAAQRAGLFNLEVGVALFVVANVLIMVALIWWNAALLYRSDLQRREAEKQLLYTARHDALTGLSNRARFVEELGRAAARSARTRSVLAVLYLDLDGFKQINDTLGHPAGDRLLQQVAERLARCCRTTDLCARLGGDEFTVLSESGALGNVETLAQRIVTDLGAPYENIASRVGVSVGVAMSGIAQAYWSQHFGGKELALVVHSGGREIPIKVYFKPGYDHAYTEDGPDGRVFAPERAQAMTRLLTTIEHPQRRMRHGDGDLLLERRIGDKHYTVVLKWNSSRKVYFFTSAHFKGYKEADRMLGTQSRTNKNGPLRQ